MGKKRIIIFSCIAVLLGAFTVGRNATSKSVSQDLPHQAHASQQSGTVPDYVVYDFLFHKVVRLREKTRELQGRSPGAKGLLPTSDRSRTYGGSVYRT